MRSIFLVGAFVLVLMLPVSARADNVACFDWDCDADPTTQVCDFDASCTQLDGSLWRFRWDFGDGSGYVFTGSATIQHQYTGNDPHPTVQLTVIPYDVPMFSVSCEILIWNYVGPPRPNHGTCSQ